LDANFDAQGCAISSIVPSAILSCLKTYSLTLPDSIANPNSQNQFLIKANDLHNNPNPLKEIQGFCKENFDSIGSKLMERNLVDHAIAFGDALANLEKI